MAFNNIMDQLHGVFGTPNMSENPTNSNAIVITDKRQFVVPENFDLVLGYAGDINTQIVSFGVPTKQEGHSFIDCQNKVLKWKNLKSGNEGQSNLRLIELSELSNLLTLQWDVPPEAMTTAGQLEIAISVFDTKDGKIAFSWNTPPFRGFSIGEGFDDYGDTWTDGELPAKNEILEIDADNRNIIAPVGYNNIFCHYGDIGTTKVYFSVNQTVRGIELGQSNVEVYVHTILGEDIAGKSQVFDIKPMFINNGDKHSNKMLLTWEPDQEITYNELYQIGNIQLSLEFIQKTGSQITKRWTTSTFSNLAIGKSVLYSDIENMRERIGDIVDEQIDEYFDNNYFITDNNE